MVKIECPWYWVIWLFNCQTHSMSPVIIPRLGRRLCMPNTPLGYLQKITLPVERKQPRSKSNFSWSLLINICLITHIYSKMLHLLSDFFDLINFWNSSKPNFPSPSLSCLPITLFTWNRAKDNLFFPFIEQNLFRSHALGHGDQVRDICSMVCIQGLQNILRIIKNLLNSVLLHYYYCLKTFLEG